MLEHALTHRSWCAENDGFDSNERLEFLGDAVLGMVVTDHLFATHPELAEGELAKIRASVVSSAALAEVARLLGLGSFLLLGKGETSSGGADKPSILADSMEAVLGAVYLDGGMGPARRLVLSVFGDRIADSVDGPGGGDFKTVLQELAVQCYTDLPTYHVTASGPDHEKRFEAVVSIGGEVRGAGSGRSKKQAEQAAARQACADLQALVFAEADDTATSAVADAGRCAHPDSVDTLTHGRGT